MYTSLRPAASPSRPAGASMAISPSRYTSDTHWTSATETRKVCSIAGNVIVTMLASNWPMNAPKQTTLTATHGARRLSRMTAGLACSCRILLLENILGPDYQVLLLANIFAAAISGFKTPDMPSAVLALAFWTRQTHGRGSGPQPS